MPEDVQPGEWPRAMGRVAPAAFSSVGIHRLEDVTRYTEKELLAIHGVGPRAIRVLREALAERGLTFRQEPPPG